MKTGVMICGHGSRSQSAVDEFAVLAEKIPRIKIPLAQTPTIGRPAANNSRT